MLVLLRIELRTDWFRLEWTEWLLEAPELASNFIFDTAFTTDGLEELLEIDLCFLDYLWWSEYVFFQVPINQEFDFPAQQSLHAHLII